MDKCKIEIQTEIDKVRQTLNDLETDLRSCENTEVDDIIDLLVEFSHVRKHNISLERFTENQIEFIIRESFFSGDGSLHKIYKQTGFHVIQCHNTGTVIYLRFRK